MGSLVMCARIHLLVWNTEQFWCKSYNLVLYICSKITKFSKVNFSTGDENSAVVGSVPSNATVPSSFLSSTSCSISFLRSSWSKLQESKASLTNSETHGLVEISSSSWKAIHEPWKWFLKRRTEIRARVYGHLTTYCSLTFIPLPG